MNQLLISLTTTFLILGNFLYSQKATLQPSVKCHIYLTFDDGPLNGSENINDIVLKEKIKISVFMVGEHVIKDKQMDTYAKYYDENPYIDEYNHSFTHANNHYEAFYNNVGKSVQDIVYNQSVLKLPYKIVRLPGRNIWRLDGRSKNDVTNGIQTADQLAALGYKVVGWEWNGSIVRLMEHLSRPSMKCILPFRNFAVQTRHLQKTMWLYYSTMKCSRKAGKNRN